MKIQSQHFVELQTAILCVIEERPELQGEYQKAGFSEERFRWDLLHLSGFNLKPLHEYLNDSHIDTALKNILKNRPQKVFSVVWCEQTCFYKHIHAETKEQAQKIGEALVDRCGIDGWDVDDFLGDGKLKKELTKEIKKEVNKL